MGLVDVIKGFNSTVPAWSIFTAGRMGDYASTIYCLENFQDAYEKNPIVNLFIENLGLYGGIAAHGVLTVAVVAACYKVVNPKLYNLLPLSVGLASVAATVNNLWPLIK